jgi:eukaryotic-like serine/threonine-protein kinase
VEFACQSSSGKHVPPRWCEVRAAGVGQAPRLARRLVDPPPQGDCKPSPADSTDDGCADSIRQPRPTPRPHAVGATIRSAVRITSGSRLGPYEILSPLGAGGMGEVYRARDTRLGREVAIKVLPAERLADEGRRRRFVQEARAASALNHPNIVTIYEIESADGIDFIVMEFVAGRTLAALIPKDGMPYREAVRLAIPVADALSAAHARDIVHRDLKPANVVVSREGGVKVLDFGLAKLVSEAQDDSGETLPTASASGFRSRPGAIIGTAAYMSPEQATGGKVDARSDVFSFGAVLYEMVTGRRAFAGKSVSDMLTSVVRDQPRPPSELARDLPLALERLIHRCLRKELERRAQHMSDVKVELQEIGDDRGSPPTARAGLPTLWKWLPLALFAAALATGVVLSIALPRTIDDYGGPVARFSLPFPEGTQLADTFPSVAISRDGSRLALLAQRGRAQEIYVRYLEGSDWKRLPGTEEALSPFFSPDGEWVGFFTADRLNRVAVMGGTPQLVCSVAAAVAPGNGTGSWGEDGWITYAGWPAPGLWRCPATGGTAEQVTGSELAEPRPVFYGRPTAVTHERALLFETWRAGRAQIETLWSSGARRRVVVEPGSSPSFAATGHLLYAWDNQILAVPFDVHTFNVHGTPVPLVEGVRMQSIPRPIADYAVSDRGILVYTSGRKPERRLVSVDRVGHVRPLAPPADDYSSPALSPDGSRVAMGLVREAGRDIWIADLARGNVSRLTTDRDALFPLWSPDSKDIVYTSSEPGQYNLFRKTVNGNGAAVRLTKSAHAQRATSWSPDGRTLLLNDIDPKTRVDVWRLTLDRGESRSPLFQTAARERAATFSPDGRWIAYESDESGHFEVYVQSYPDLEERRQVSTDGGIQPSWNTNGRELLYTAGDEVMSVSFDPGERLRLGKPQILFRASFVANDRYGEYSVNPDGRGFLFLDDVEQEPHPQLTVVVSWFQELKRRVPVVR